ncbi:MAG: hypothetical protein IJR70_03635 [Eubacterium sp.]|nr:hypothetical protein [Eubacterium sp.]
MINLPKPSELTMKNFSKGQSEYILSYLKTLVSALEKMLPSKKSDEKNKGRYVEDIRLKNSVLKVRFSDGEVKELDISNQ